MKEFSVYLFLLIISLLLQSTVLSAKSCNTDSDCINAGKSHQSLACVNSTCTAVKDIVTKATETANTSPSVSSTPNVTSCQVDSDCPGLGQVCSDDKTCSNLVSAQTKKLAPWIIVLIVVGLVLTCCLFAVCTCFMKG